jgi:hypothetical protein
VRAEILRCEGTEVDTAGDGFFVRFGSPARALECTRAAREGVKRLGIDIRVGIHTGECELQGRLGCRESTIHRVIDTACSTPSPAVARIMGSG